MEKPYGALITAVAKGGPAEAAGLKIGDVVLSVQGVRVDNQDVLGYRLSTAGIGNTVSVEIMRDGKNQTIPVKLSKAPEVKETAPQVIKGDNPFAGAAVLVLTPSTAKKLRLKSESQGVVVVDVYSGSPAARLGLRPGDIVRSINGNPIRSVEEMTAILDGGRGLAWRLEVERNGTLLRQFVR